MRWETNPTLLAFDASSVKLFSLETPDQFRLMRSLDDRLFRAGLPHLFALAEHLLSASR